jgi:hypothetical protein
MDEFMVVDWGHQSRSSKSGGVASHLIGRVGLLIDASLWLIPGVFGGFVLCVTWAGTFFIDVQLPL